MCLHTIAEWLGWLGHRITIHHTAVSAGLKGHETCVTSMLALHTCTDLVVLDSALSGLAGYMLDIVV